MAGVTRGNRKRPEDGGHPDPAVLAMLTLLMAYDKNDASAFNQALAEYEHEVSGQLPPEAKTTRFELFFNRFEPFYVCTLMYFVVGVLACVSFLLLCFRARTGRSRCAAPRSGWP